MTASADRASWSAEPYRRASVWELARQQGVRPVRSAADLIQDGVWESDEELDAFLADLHALRHSDPAAS